MAFIIAEEKIEFDQYKRLNDYIDVNPVVMDILSFMEEWNKAGVNTFAFHTTGSTDKPKQIFHSRKAMLLSAQYTQDFFSYGQGDTSALALPMQYVSGKMMLVRAIYSDLDLHLIPISSDPFNELNTSIDFIALTPMQLEIGLIKHPKKISLLNKILLGGAPVNSELESKIQNCTKDVYLGFGMTESLTHVAVRKLNGQDKTNYYKSVSSEIKFSTDSDSCLIIDAPHLNGLINTQDEVELLSDNKFIWFGRKDNIINTGGLKVNAEKLENFLKEKIEVKLFVFGQEDKLLGQKIAVALEAEPSELIIQKMENAFCDLDKNTRPKELYFLKTFVYSPNFKILKNETIKCIALK